MGLRAVTLTLAGLSMLGAVACASVLGIQDRTLDPGDDDGGGGTMSDAGASTDGPPVQLATGLNHPLLMAADEANVYWTEFGDDVFSTNGSVKSCPVSGCASGPLVYAVLQSNPRGIAIDAQNVYWGTIESQDVAGGIWSCPLAGCTNGKPTRLVTANAPFQITLDAAFVYWADNFDNSVHRASKADGTDTVLSDGGSGSTAIFDGQGCVVDKTFVFVTDYNFDLFRVPIAGGNLVQLYSQSQGYQGPAPVTVDDSAVYLGTPGQILAFGKTTGGAGKALVSSVAGPDDLEIDPATGDLYWSDWGSGTGTDGTVGKVPTDGGAATVLHQNLVTPEAVAVNSTYLFWLSNGTLGNSQSGATDVGTGILYRAGK